jgi:hypothetical protein
MAVESFFGSEAVDGAMSADKVREFQERMARNAQAMAAARQQEQKQKKKEDKLAAILLKFIKTHTRGDIILLVSRCLEQNMPAVFILSVVLLGNEDVQQEVGVHLQLASGSSEAEIPVSMDNPAPTPGAVVRLGEDATMPIKMRIALELWSQALWESISPIPERILKSVVEFNEDLDAVLEPKEVVAQLTTFILRDYFVDNGAEQPYENLKSFAEFLMKGLLKRLKEQIENQKQLGE